MTAGPQYRADDRPGGSAKFEEFKDVPGGFVAERFVFTYRPKEGFALHFKAWDVTQKDQRFSLVFGKQNRFRAYFTWAENPRRWTDRAKMLYADRGDGVLTLDDGLQSAVQGAPASDPGSANAIYLGMDYLNYENHVLSALLRYRY